jgi:membrane protease subunit HflK
VEDVYSKTQKVIIDSSGTGNLIYLPLDKLVRGDGRSGNDSEGVRLGENLPAAASPQSTEEVSRDRRTRQ